MNDKCLGAYDVDMLASDYYGYHDPIFGWVDMFRSYIMLIWIDCADNISYLEIH